MNPESSFTSRLYNKEIKISKHSHELNLEVLNLETLQFFSCTIKQQDLNPSFSNLEELFKLLCDGFQKNSKIVRTTITEDMAVSLWVARLDHFEYPLSEVAFMSSEHLERFQQRITDCNDFSLYLPKNSTGVWSALLLKNQMDQNKKLKQPQQEGLIDENLTQKLTELEEQVKFAKEDNRLLKTQIENLNSHLRTNLWDIEERLRSFSKYFEKEKASSKENDNIQYQMDKIFEELRELKTKLDTKVDKAKKEIQDIQDIDFVESLHVREADLKGHVSAKAIEDMIRNFDEKITKVYEFITNTVKETQEANEKAIREIKEANEKAINAQKESSLQQYHGLFTKIEKSSTSQREQTNNKLQALDTKLERLENESKVLPEKIASLGEKISQVQVQFEVLQGQLESQDYNGVVDYVNRTVQEVKGAIERDIDAKRIGDVNSFEAKLEQLKQTQTNYVNEKIQEGVNGLEAVFLANEADLKTRIDTLSELIGNI